LQVQPAFSPIALRICNPHAQTMSPNSELHVVVGAGQVGSLLALRLLARGHRVRVVRRGTPLAALPGVEWARGDISDATFAEQAFRGARAVYHCANPAGFRWDGLPTLARVVRQSAGRAGARLVVLDNLFMYGRAEGGILREDQPHAPCSRKGEIRARLARELFQAHQRGDVRAAAGHAGDFFGPTASDQSALFGTRFLASLRAGRRCLTLGDPDQPHAYSYLPDVAEGLAVLGGDDAALGRAWHLPTAWNGSTRELMERFSLVLGRKLRLLRMPTWALRLAGIFSHTLGEAAEMTYQWEAPYRLDDTAFRRLFAVSPTPIDRAVQDTLRAAGLLGRGKPTDLGAAGGRVLAAGPAGAPVDALTTTATRASGVAAAAAGAQEQTEYSGSRDETARHGTSLIGSPR
jgi:nucleoside-diphosphate-sugar epimerase